MTTRTTEAQDYNSIGELSPEGEATLTTQKTWDGIATEPPPREPSIDQLQGHDFSAWNKRNNRMALATSDGDTNYAEDFFEPGTDAGDAPPRAGYAIDQGYTETPTAATRPVPFEGAPDGTMSGATAAHERSGNRGADPSPLDSPWP